MKLVGCNVLRTGGCNPLLFYQFLHFFCIRNFCTIYTQQVRAWSRSCVDRVVVFLLALGCLQLLMNLLQYAKTLMSFLSFENLCVMPSGGCRSATSTFLVSRFFMGVLTSVAGQLHGSCVSHCGPFHHSVDVDRVAGSTHLEMTSAGLD